MWVEKYHQLDLQKVVSRISACFQTPLSIICLAGLDLITFPILLGFQMLATPVMHFFKCRHPSLWISVALVPRPKVTEFFCECCDPGGVVPYVAVARIGQNSPAAHQLVKTGAPFLKL